MQSWIEVDKEALYTLKINFKGKRTVRKANKGINVEKHNSFKKIKIIKKRKKWKKKEKRGKKKKEENATELQKPNIEAEVYSNNKKYDWIYTYAYIPISKIKTAQEK